MYDLIIIGMGPAGLSAGIYAKRAGLNVLVLEKNAPGGLLLKIKKVDNYLGFTNIDASTLALKMFEHFNSHSITYNIEEVIKVEDKENYKLIKTNKKIYKTKNVLITTGMQRKKLKLDNEDILLEKEVSYCVVCDAPLYKNKEVAIIGTEKSIEDVEYLKTIAKKVYFITTNKINVDNTEVINKQIKHLTKKDKFKLTFEDNSTVSVDGLFVDIGNTQNSFDRFLRNKKGFIEVNKLLETKIKGIYAAGDAIQKELYQICTAVSEGAIAINNIKRTKE